MNNTTLVAVVNITDGPVIYKVPELSIRRTFNKGESKRISVEELRALSYQPGGMVLLREYLSIRDNEVLAELGIKTEPEYNWGAEEVKDLLLTGSLARLLDCLDYAPAGIIELVKEYAVSLKINDMSKRDAIRKSTGLDVNHAIEVRIEEEEAAKANTGGETAASGRRVQPEAAATTSKYKVVG